MLTFRPMQRNRETAVWVVHNEADGGEASTLDPVALSSGTAILLRNSGAQRGNVRAARLTAR